MSFYLFLYCLLLKYWLVASFNLCLFIFIAFGNGLFKGNLQAIVGQMYDNLEKEAEKKDLKP